MTLKEYLSQHKITVQTFADQVKASYGTVVLWRQGKTIPRKPLVKKIERLTKGKVRPVDWYVN